MFGNAPKPLWQRWIMADDRNRIPLACRAMLIREERADRWILLETGIGAFFDPVLRDRYGVQEEQHVLLESLSSAGVSHEEIDVVVLSHLHFDHAGGLLDVYRAGEPPRLLFPGARFVVGADAWQRATEPHDRDRASFIAELPGLLEASGRLEIVQGATSATLGPDYRLHRSEGHTPGLLLTEVPSEEGPIVFAADLIPGRPWVHLPITMGYDRFPEKLIDEKQALLSGLVTRRGRLFFTHDAACAMARVERDERGRFRAGQEWPRPEGLPI